LLLQGMLLERTQAFDMGMKTISQVAERAEQKYEVTESSEELIKFCKAKTLLSRMFLGNMDFDKAIEAGQTALDILESGDYEKAVKSFVLSALLSTGLAHYFNGSFDDSINCFRRALELSQEAQDVVILLVQVLWATGGQQQREVALEQLYASVDSRGSGMRITLILGVLGLIQDQELLEACQEELEGLSLDELELDKEANVQEVLSLITQSMKPWQRAALFWPSNHNIWKRLDPRIALHLAQCGGGVTAEELSEVQLKADTGLESSQRGVFLAPWKPAGWNQMAQCIMR
jgi:superkiller protein 3